MLSKPHKIVVAGLNIHGLISALMLRKSYPADLTQITLVGRSSENIPSQAVVVDQSLKHLLMFYGKNESSWMSQTMASFKLRNHYLGWGGKTFSVCVKSDVELLHYPSMFEVSKLKRLNYLINYSIDDFFFAGALAERNLSPIGKDFPFEIDYQYQVDMHLLEELLIKLARQQSIDIIEKEIDALQLDQFGNLQSVQCAEEPLMADYYFDCTGAKQSLISRMPGYSQEKLKQIRVNDRIIKLRLSSSKIASETICEAIQTGFVKQYSLTGYQEFHYYYSSKFISDELALKQFSQLLFEQKGMQVNEYSLQHINDHLVSIPWINNCLAIGPACGFAGGIEDYDLAHTFSMCENFVSCMKGEGDANEMINNFNQRAKSRFIYLLSFNNTLLLLNKNRKSPYWKTPQNLDVFPPIGKELFIQWMNGQDLNIEPMFDIIGINGWYALFGGLEHYPTNNLQQHPEAQTIQNNIEEIRRKLKGCCLNFQTNKVTLAGEFKNV